MCLCFSHSSAQASHILEQSAQISFAYLPPILIMWAADLQNAEHSRSRFIHSNNIFMSFSFRSSDAQWSHAVAHVLQASIQLWNFSWLMFLFFFYWQIIIRCKRYAVFVFLFVKILWMHAVRPKIYNSPQAINCAVHINCFPQIALYIECVS
jgi:hypothetical protein